MTSRAWRLSGGAVLALAALAYRSCFGYLFFGRLKDDAWYWLAARSLLSGRYVDLADPARPPLSAPMPGFPLLLVPAAALGSPALARWLNLGLSVGGAALALRLLRDEPALALAAAALAALNPLSVLAATPVMTDPAFFFFSIAALAALAPWWRRAPTRMTGVAGAAALAAASAWMRPEGWLVIAASSVALASERRTRQVLAPYAAVAVPLAAAPYAWMAWRAGSGDYLRQFGFLSPEFHSGAENAGSELLRTAASNARFYAEALGKGALLSWVPPIPGSASPAALLAGGVVLCVLGWQTVRALREGGPARLLSAYAVLYVAAHLFWVNQFRRYLFPLLPLLYWLLVRPLARRPRWLLGASGALLAGFLAVDALLARQSFTPRPYDNVPPAGTFAWLREHTRAEDVLAGSYREMFAYYTGRAVLELSSAGDDEAWYRGLAERRVRFVVYRPGGERVRTTRMERFAENARITQRRLEDARRFRLAYRAPGEPFVIYELLGPSRSGPR